MFITSRCRCGGRLAIAMGTFRTKGPVYDPSGRTKTGPHTATLVSLVYVLNQIMIYYNLIRRPCESIDLIYSEIRMSQQSGIEVFVLDNSDVLSLFSIRFWFYVLSRLVALAMVSR